MTGKDFRQLAAAIRVSWTWLGGTKKVRGATKEALTDFLGTTSQAVGADKRLFAPTSGPVKALQTLRHEAEKYWRDHSLPYLEKGVRLVKRADYPAVKAEMERYRERLAEAEVTLQEQRDLVLQEAQEFLGDRLFNEGDYPATFLGAHGFEMEAVNVEPPSYLMQLDPAAYEAAQARLDQKFESALEMWEEQAYTGLSEMLNHLVEKMRPGEDGKKKVFHTSSFDNLLEFFKRYKGLKVRDNPALDDLVRSAEEKLAAFDVGGIRSSEKIRGQVLAAFEGLAQEAAKHVTSLPKRKVDVKKAPEAEKVSAGGGEGLKAYIPEEGAA